MILVNHDPNWRNEFKILKSVYADILGESIIAVEHVGSTAIEGIVAKPILDIDIVIADEASFGVVKDRLLLVGYWHNGDQGVPTREVFKRVDEHVPYYNGRQAWMLHHLYVCLATSPELARHIAFRDYLRVNADARRQYEAIKLEIASRSKGDRKLYARLKEQESVCGAFVATIIEKQTQQGLRER